MPDYEFRVAEWWQEFSKNAPYTQLALWVTFWVVSLLILLGS